MLSLIPDSEEQQDTDALPSLSECLTFIGFLSFFVFYGFLAIEVLPNLLKAAHVELFIKWGWFSWTLFSIFASYLLTDLRQIQKKYAYSVLPSSFNTISLTVCKLIYIGTSGDILYALIKMPMSEWDQLGVVILLIIAITLVVIMSVEAKYSTVLGDELKRRRSKR